MVAALRSVSTVVTGSGSVVITKPTGTVSGDVLHAYIANVGGTSTPTLSGWTLLQTSSNSHGFVLRKVAGGAEPSTYTFTTAGSESNRGQLACYSGVDNTTPEDVAVPSFQTNNSSTATAPSVTTVTNNALVIRAEISHSSASSFTSIAGLAVVSNSNYINLFSQTQVTAGAVGTTTFAAVGGSNNWPMTTIALRPGAGGDTTAPGPVTSLSATTSPTSMLLTWTNPGDGDYSGAMVRRATGGTPPANTSAGTLVSDVLTPTASVTDAGLSSSTQYSYSVFAHDGSGNYAAAATATATTDASSGAPSPVTAVTHSENLTGVTLHWTNPSDGGFSGVMVRRATGSTPPASTGSGTLVSDVASPDAVVTDTGLSSGTTYSYSLFAHNTDPTYAGATTVTVTTLSSVAAPSAGTRPIAVPQSGWQKLGSDSVFRPAGQKSQTQGGGAGYMRAPNLLSRTPHMHEPSFQTGVLSQTSQIQHIPMIDCSDLRFVWGNYQAATDNTNNIVVRAGFKVSDSTFYPITFEGGGRDAVIAPGATVTSDPLPIECFEDTPVWTRTKVTVLSGEKFPLSMFTSIAANGEGYDRSGADLTTSGTITAANYLDLYGPCAMSAMPAAYLRPVPCVAIIGDSIAAAESPVSCYETALVAAHIPYINLSKAGDAVTYAWAAPQRLKRFKFVNQCTHAICTLGINDLASSSLAQLQAAQLNLWTAFYMRGIRASQTTITPHTDSTDSFTSVSGQTTKTGESVRTGFNDWVRAGAPINATTKAAVAIGSSGALLSGTLGHPLTGYHEIADTLETSRNSGIHRLDDGTTDGTHPGQSGHNLMQPNIDLTLFTPRR